MDASSFVIGRRIVQDRSTPPLQFDGAPPKQHTRHSTHSFEFNRDDTVHTQKSAKARGLSARPKGVFASPSGLGLGRVPPARERPIAARDHHLRLGRALRMALSLNLWQQYTRAVYGQQPHASAGTGASMIVIS